MVTEMARAVKANREQHKKKGLCIYCTRKVVPNRTMCQYHLDYHKFYKKFKKQVGENNGDKTKARKTGQADIQGSD